MIAQLIIFITGAPALWLSMDSRYLCRKWAPVLGLLGQPAWFYTSLVTEQWGILLVSVLYAAAWFKGFWRYWLSEAKHDQQGS